MKSNRFVKVSKIETVSVLSILGWLWRPGDAERRGGCIRQWAWLAETGVRISLIAGYPLNLSERPFTAREALPLLSYAATRANPFDGPRWVDAWGPGRGGGTGPRMATSPCGAMPNDRPLIT